MWAPSLIVGDKSIQVAVHRNPRQCYRCTRWNTSFALIFSPVVNPHGDRSTDFFLPASYILASVQGAEVTLIFIHQTELSALHCTWSLVEWDVVCRAIWTGYQPEKLSG